MCLKEDSYCKLMADTIEEADKEELTNARSKWDYIKYKIRSTAIQYGKQRARTKRQERMRVEDEYAKAIAKGNNDESAENAKNQLLKFYQEEDDIIRFHAKVNEAEYNERISPYH